MSPFFPNKPPIEWDSRQYVTWKIWAEAQNQDCWEILDSTLNLLNPSQLPVAQFWNTQVQCRLLQVIDLFNSRARQIAQLQDIQNCLQINNIRLAWLENRVRFEPDQETPLRATLNEASLLRTGAALVEQQLSGDFPRILSEWLLVPNRCRITTACGLLDRLIQNTNEHIRHLYDRIELEGAILNELLGNNPHGFIPSPSELFIVSPETVVVSLVGSLILLFIILFLWRKGCFPMGGRIKARPEDDSELGQLCLLEMDNATLNRFFSLHYLLPFVTAGASLIHLAALHQYGSNNPLGINSSVDKIALYPYLYVKDLVGWVAFAIFFSIWLFYAPNVLGHPDNYMPANAMSTPAHIVPEWYFLPIYAILRSIPNKLGGVAAIGLVFASLLALPFLNTSAVRSSSFRLIYQRMFWLLLADCLLLGWIGCQPVEAPYVTIGQMASVVFFSYFAITPILGQIEARLVIHADDTTRSRHENRSYVHPLAT